MVKYNLFFGFRGGEMIFMYFFELSYGKLFLSHKVGDGSQKWQLRAQESFEEDLMGIIIHVSAEPKPTPVHNCKAILFFYNSRPSARTIRASYFCESKTTRDRARARV